MISTLKETPPNQSAFSCLFLITVSLLSLEVAQGAFAAVDNPNFRAGPKELFTDVLTVFPYNVTYDIVFSSAATDANATYDLVVSINSFHFIETSTMSYNLTKSSVSNTGFSLLYETGIESIIYTLSINFMVIDNSYTDVEISFVNHTCSVMNSSAGKRSENISSTITKFANSSDIDVTVLLESFNITNTQNDFIVLEHTVYLDNFTVTARWETSGFNIVREVQFYFICHDRASQNFYYQRFVSLKDYEIPVNGHSDVTYNNDIDNRYKFTDRLFSGISGFNFSKIGQKEVDFQFAVNLNFTLDFASAFNGSIESVQMGMFMVYDRSCGTGEYYLSPDACVSTCTAPEDYLDSENSVCRLCHFSCATCGGDYSEGHCLTCFDSSRSSSMNSTVGGIDYYTCPCAAGYYENGTNSCIACSSVLTQCSACSDSVTCTACQSGMTLINGTCLCDNQVQVFIGGSCRDGTIGCESYAADGSTLICTECYTERGFTLTAAFGCECDDTTYKHIENPSHGVYYCNYTCGDGYVSSDEGCDDSNSVSGDGCSDACEVESNFTCSGSLTVTSVCQYNLVTNLTYVSAERVLYANSMIVNFTLYPYITFLDTVNLTACTSHDIPSTTITSFDLDCPSDFSSLECRLSYTMDFGTHIETQTRYNLWLSLESCDSTFAYNSSTVSMELSGETTQLSYKSASVLSMLATMEIIALILCLMAVAITLAALIFVDKMIGVELLFSCQTVYFLLATLQNSPVEMVPFIRAVRYVNGYNVIEPYAYYRYQPLPDQLNHICFEEEYLLNFNIMLGVLWVSFISVLVLRLIIKCKGWLAASSGDSLQQEQQQQFAGFLTDQDESSGIHCTLSQAYALLVNKGWLFIGLATASQTVFATVVTTIDQTPNEIVLAEQLNVVVLILTFCLLVLTVCSIFHWYCQESPDSESTRLTPNPVLPFEFSLCRKQYLPTLVAFQCLKITCLAFLFQKQLALYVFLAVCFIYFIVLAFLRPYQIKQDTALLEDETDEEKLCLSIHNASLCLNELIILGFGAVCLMWNLVVDNYAFDDDFGSIFLYFALGCILVLNVLACLRLFYKRLGVLACCNKQSQVNDSVDLNSEEGFKNMRKLIRDSDLVYRNNRDEANSENEENDKSVSETSRKFRHKQKKKILNDIRKNKQYFINWNQDNGKTPSKQSESASDSQQSSQQSNLKKESHRKKSDHSSDESDSEVSTKKNKTKHSKKQDKTLKQENISRKKKQKVVQMKQLTDKKPNNIGFPVQKASTRKNATLNSSVIDSLLDKKYLQNPDLYMPKTSIYQNTFNLLEGSEESEKNSDQANLRQIKARLNTQYLTKQQQEKDHMRSPIEMMMSALEFNPSDQHPTGNVSNESGKRTRKMSEFRKI